MDLEKLNSRTWGKGRRKKKVTNRGRKTNHKRLLNTENKLRIDGGVVGERGKWVMGTEEGAFWDEPWMLYVSNESWEFTP